MRWILTQNKNGIIYIWKNPIVGEKAYGEISKQTDAEDTRGCSVLSVSAGRIFHGRIFHPPFPDGFLNYKVSKRKSIHMRRHIGFVSLCGDSTNLIFKWFGRIYKKFGLLVKIIRMEATIRILSWFQNISLKISKRTI